MGNYISVILLIVSIGIFFTCSSKGKEGSSSNKDKEGGKVLKKADNRLSRVSDKDYSDRVTDQMIERDISRQAKGEKDNSLGDSSWVILINSHKITKKEFEKDYYRFIRHSGKKISKKDFISFFLLNYSINKGARAYFASGSRAKLLKFIKTQAVIKEYLKSFISKKKIKSPSHNELRRFYRALIREKRFKRLNFDKDKKKIILLYSNHKANQEYAFLEQKLIGKFRVIKNDEWEDGIIEKYIDKKIDLNRALGSRYKEYWLFRIVVKRVDNRKGSQKKLSKHKDIKPYTVKQTYYIKDIENKIRMLSLSGFNPLLVKKFKRDVGVRKVIINSFLTEVLAYTLLKKTKLLYSKRYKKVAYDAGYNFMTTYYARNVLKLRTDTAKQEYIWDIITSNRIKSNKTYFAGVGE